jgi:hypothetical protein
MDLGDRRLNAACDDRICSHTRSRKTHKVVIAPTFRMERSPNDSVKGYFIKVTPFFFEKKKFFFCRVHIIVIIYQIWPNLYKNL